jgi:hypothetical protein
VSRFAGLMASLSCMSLSCRPSARQSSGVGRLRSGSTSMSISAGWTPVVSSSPSVRSFSASSRFCFRANTDSSATSGRKVGPCNCLIKLLLAAVAAVSAINLTCSRCRSGLVAGSSVRKPALRVPLEDASRALDDCQCLDDSRNQYLRRCRAPRCRFRVRLSRKGA